MPKSLVVGRRFYLSWGDDLQQDDQAFYGVAVLFGPFRWAFLGVAVDRQEQPQRDERQRLLETFGNLESLLGARTVRGWVETAEVRDVLDRTDGPHRWDRTDVG